MTGRNDLGLQPGRNAFGDLLVDIKSLPYRERINAYRRLAGKMQAADDPEIRRHGREWTEFFTSAGDPDLDEFLGIKPPAGCTTTPQEVVRIESRNRLLLQLAAAVGCDAKALRMLRGERPPGRHHALVQEAIEAGCPTSRAAITRARESVSLPQIAHVEI